MGQREDDLNTLIKGGLQMKELKVFGMKDWTKDFGEQFRPGQLFTVAVAEHFLNVLPPASYSLTFVQCGEPYAHRKDTDGRFKPIYLTLEAVKGTFNDIDSVWKYCGHCFEGKKENVK